MATPAHRLVARWLLEYEMDGAASDSDQLPIAMERIAQKFFDRLEKAASLAACQGLLSQAVHISRAEFSFLQGVRAGLGAAPVVDGLATSVKRVDRLEARAGVEEMLGTFIRLLAALIGQDLTLGMLCDVWPGLPTLNPPFSENPV